MKKILSLLVSMCAVLSAVSATAYAQEYEKCPSSAEFASSEEWYKEISDGINEGRYFADFDGNGTFNPVDAEILLAYYTRTSFEDEATDWSDRTTFIQVDEDCCADFFDGYEITHLSGFSNETFVSVPLNNEMLANVKKYGDITGDGYIMSDDMSALIGAYYSGFELGDVNTDNRIDATDASYVLSYYASVSTHYEVDTYTERAMTILGDVNGDGFVMANDAAYILMMYSNSAVTE